LKRYKKILRLVLVVICLVYLLQFFHKNRESLQLVFALNFKTILNIILLQLLYYLLQGHRFQVVLEKCSSRKIPFLPWLRIFILGRFLNTVFSQMGNVYRSVQLKQQHSISYTRYISSFGSLAWMDTGINLMIAVIAIAVLNPGFKIGQFFAWKILAILTFAVVASPILGEIILRRISFKNKYLDWLHSKFSEVLDVLLSNLQDRAYVLKITLLVIAIFARTCAMFYVYFSVFDIQISIPALVVFCALFQMSTFVIITPGNVGVQEVVYGFLSEQIGIGMAQGVLVAALIRVVGICSISVLGVSLGGIDLLRHRKDYLEIKD
jgi:uncharacterized membrane protein YbhN (UPF0104 family)